MTPVAQCNPRVQRRGRRGQEGHSESRSCGQGSSRWTTWAHQPRRAGSAQKPKRARKEPLSPSPRKAGRPVDTWLVGKLISDGPSCCLRPRVCGRCPSSHRERLPLPALCSPEPALSHSPQALRQPELTRAATMELSVAEFRTPRAVTR